MFFLRLTLSALLASLVGTRSSLAMNSSPDGDYNERLRQIESELFSFEPNAVLSIDEIDMKLDSLNLNDLDDELANELEPDSSHIIERLQNVKWFSENEGCAFYELSRRSSSVPIYENFQNIADYIKFHNDRIFNKCILFYKESIETDLQSSRDERVNLDELYPLIINRQSQLNQELQYQANLSKKMTAQGAMDYLEMKGYNIEKPRDRPMIEHIENVISPIISQHFDDECIKTKDRFGYPFMVRAIISDYDENLVQLLGEDALKLFNQMYICFHLTNTNAHMFPLGKYDLESIQDQIFSFEPSDELMNPEEVKNLIEIALFASQANLFAQMVDLDLARKLVDFLTISQINPNKCEADYLNTLIALKANNREYPNLYNYLDFYGQKQMISCLSSFESRLLYKIFSLSNRDLNNVNEIYGYFESAKNQIDPNAKLYRDISDQILAASLEKWFESLRNKATEGPSGSRTSYSSRVRASIRTLFDSCQEIVDFLHQESQDFRRLVKLDSGPESEFQANTLIMMQKYNICAAILRVPDQIRFESQN